MSESTPNSLPAAAAEVEVRKRRGPSLVWLIPVVALLIGGGIAYDTISSKGPTIKLNFKDGAGLEAGKTKIKYRSVDVGVLNTIELRDDMKGVVAEAELNPAAGKYMSEKTVFWKVSPRISLAGVTGLDTLVSGNYVAMLPHPGEGTHEFDVLDAPPLAAEHSGALSIQVLTDDLGSIGEGSPVTYRDVRVGAVEKYELIDQGHRFRIHAAIDKEYADLVKKDSQFWNASGLDVSIGAEGVQFHQASLASLLGGGLAFDTPAWAKDSPSVEKGASFDLYASSKAALEARERKSGLNIMVEARDGSIAKDAPVYYRKHKVGHVGESKLSDDATTVVYQVHIEARYAELVRTKSRFWNASGVNVHVGMGGLDLQTDSLETILAGGLEFASPDRPGSAAKSGALFALYEKPEPAWLAWAPRIDIDASDGTRKVAHVLPRAGGRKRGLSIVLESFSVGSIKAGDAIYYRKVKVGEIGKHELSRDAQTVRIHGQIEPRYATLLRANSRFWDVSGIRAHLGLTGLDIKTGSLESMLAGGVAFATPDAPGDPVEPGTIFPLHPEGKDDWQRWSPAIPIDPSRSDEAVKHAIHADTHPHLFPKKVGSEAQAPGGEPSGTAPVSSAPAEEKKKRPGFIRRLFGGGSEPQD